MKTLLTGSNGFLGHKISENFISEELSTLNRTSANIKCDLSKEIPKLNEFDLVIHAAGKAHVIPKTDEERQLIYNVNVEGTKNLLKALSQTPNLPTTFVFISSVAVYGQEHAELINEGAQLSAKDPYGESKIMAEELVLNWCKINNVICTILRLPLLAGVNPPGNLQAMINAIKHGYYVNIDGGKARKSMVLAQDVGKIIPIAANIGGIFNLTDGYHPSFFELSQIIAHQLGKAAPLNIPLWLAKSFAQIGDIIGPKAPIDSEKLIKITSTLTFDDSKAKQVLGWKPSSVLKNFKIR